MIPSSDAVTFTPAEVSRERTLFLNNRPEVVFPLFEPLNERKWADGWDPDVLFPSNGVAREGMIFLTKPRFDGEENYRWVLTHYDTENFRISYHVSTADRLWFIDVACIPMEDGTAATVCYTYIGLTAEAASRNNAALEMMFQNNLKDWEDAINMYLASNEHELT